MRMCERCREAPAADKERFCAKCRKQVLKELRTSGFLPPRMMQGNMRTREMKQERMDGEENPWQSNAVRALEDSG